MCKLIGLITAEGIVIKLSLIETEAAEYRNSETKSKIFS